MGIIRLKEARHRWALGDLVVLATPMEAARWNLGTWTTEDLARMRVVPDGTTLKRLLEVRPEYADRLLDVITTDGEWREK